MSHPEAPALSATDVPQRIVVDQRINPDRRRPVAAVDRDGASVTWNGLLKAGGVFGVLAVLWGLFRGAAALQDTPAKLDAVIVTQKAQTDTINATAATVRTLSRDMSTAQTRIGNLEQRVQAEEQKSAAVDAAKTASDRLHQDLSDRMRELEMRGPVGRDRPRY